MRCESLTRFSLPFALLVALAVLLSPAAALVASAQPQSQAPQSVAEAARKARAEREARKKSQKPVKEITEDDLARQGGPIAGGEPAPAKPASEQAAAPEQPAAAKTAEEAASEAEAGAAAAKKLAEQEAELKELKAQLATAQKDAEIQQRDLALKKEQFYSQTDFAHDADGKARLDAAQNQLADKQQEIEKLKTKIAALQELIDRAKKLSPR
jgi:hypothetical protein